ncbi:MAG TPA: cyanophycin synthetase, partial [Dermatophilaceae bacterium]|nr:cyanophycin synthetase [Dermatophilaceae bacterium]
NYYLSPGRLNLVEVNNVEVFVDYCHNAAGMRALGDFVDRYAATREGRADLGRVSRIGAIGSAGDRRDSDLRELGAVAARHFDVLVVREDSRLRGRRPGEAAELIREGVLEAMQKGGVRCRQVDIVLDELQAVGHIMARANPGDLVVVCVDKSAEVFAALEDMTRQAQPGSHGDGVADPDLDPVELYDAAAASGAAAGAAAEDLAMSPASADEDGESDSEATTEG